MLFKDAANLKSNQKNIGTIKSSNLCTEIIEYSDSKESAVCNLASIALSMFVNDDKTFNYDKLHEVTKIVTDNLNKVIDINFYPTEKTLRSNMRHRPIGIGVQGLADVFALMDIPFESDDAKKINKNIFETIYHGALEKSMEISKERKEDLLFLVEKKKGWSDHKKDYVEEKTWTFSDFSSDCQSYKTQGAEIKEKLLKHNPTPPEIILAKQHPNFAGSYSSIEGSPISKGIFQFDLWGVSPSDRYDWNKLKEQVKENGVRNSLLLAPMPTASTSSNILETTNVLNH